VHLQVQFLDQKVPVADTARILRKIRRMQGNGLLNLQFANRAAFLPATTLLLAWATCRRHGRVQCTGLPRRLGLRPLSCLFLLPSLNRLNQALHHRRSLWRNLELGHDFG
jgi:hypothetical protein